MSPEKLAQMANQIGKFFAHEGPVKAPASIAEHLVRFWDPRMRAALKAHAAAGGGLDPLVQRAVELLPAAPARA